MTVEELLARITSRELAEWAAYEREFGPLGLERGDWHAATVSHVVAAAAGGKGRITDFLPRWGRRRQTAEEQLAIFRALASRGDERQWGDERQ